LPSSRRPKARRTAERAPSRCSRPCTPTSPRPAPRSFPGPRPIRTGRPKPRFRSGRRRRPTDRPRPMSSRSRSRPIRRRRTAPNRRRHAPAPSNARTIPRRPSVHRARDGRRRTRRKPRLPPRPAAATPAPTRHRSPERPGSSAKSAWLPPPWEAATDVPAGKSQSFSNLLRGDLRHLALVGRAGAGAIRGKKDVVGALLARLFGERGHGVFRGALRLDIADLLTVGHDPLRRRERDLRVVRRAGCRDEREGDDADDSEDPSHEAPPWKNVPPTPCRRPHGVLRKEGRGGYVEPEPRHSSAWCAASQLSHCGAEERVRREQNEAAGGGGRAHGPEEV